MAEHNSTRRRSRIIIILLLLLAMAVVFLYRQYQPVHPAIANTDWREYNGNGERNHYSPLAQINQSNLGKLAVAWTYSSGGADTVGNHTQMQCNPVIVNGVLYGVNAATQAFAVDAANGKELWKTAVSDNGGTTSRGLTYFEDSSARTIFFGAGKWLYALDAGNGKPVTGFGDSGRIDLKKGLERPGGDNYAVANTPNTIYKNLIITGLRVSESETALLGDIRAFDVHSGALVWTFKTIPEKGTPGYETWAPEPRAHLGAANAWAGMAIDRARGIVYAPTGSAAFDFYGGNRPGNNLYANCLLALDAATGKLLWHFQLVHHDIWDRDPPAPPNLLTVMHDGKKVDAVAQITKQGYVFVFDRVTGRPLFPIQEQHFEGDPIAGEQPSLTQPVPILPVPFTRQSFTSKDFNSFVQGKEALIKILAGARTGHAFIPVNDSMTIIFPGTDGGAQWGGAAADINGIMYIPAKEIPCYTSLTTAVQTGNTTGNNGQQLFNTYCAGCHGADRTGNHDGSYPSLLNADKRLSASAVLQILEKGRGMMPSFSHIDPAQRHAITDFILNRQTGTATVTTKQTAEKLPYRHTGYNRWYDAAGYPVSTPPWGTLTAMDINTGQQKWQVELGEYKALTEKGIPATGTDNYGGPLLTAGGLIFIAATMDQMFRAFDPQTGKMLWQTALPAAGYASPSTYAVNGKQFIVIACGGGKLNTKSGDKYVAFAIKD